jgi:hypothetical protein
MNEIFEKYGFPGAAIIGLSWFIMYLMRQHKEERKEWKDSNDRITREMNDNIKDNTNILAGLKTLLENKK